MFIKNVLVVKNKTKTKNAVNYALSAHQINSYWRFFFLKKKKVEVLVIPVAIECLLYLIPSHVKGKFMYFLKDYLVQKLHAQLHSISLSSSIIITKLLSACQVALTACFRNCKISFTSLEFWSLTFWRLTFEFWGVDL